MTIKVELRCVFVAAYFVKTGYCSVNQITLWYGERISQIARRKQQESDEVKKTPVGIKENEIEHFTVYDVALSIEKQRQRLTHIFMSV